MARECDVVDVGTMAFGECWELQQQLFKGAIAAKSEGEEPRHTIILVEHPPVYTLGKSGKDSNLLVAEEFLKSIGAVFFHIDRGGDITFHGPGQIVGYPILDLAQLGIGLKDYTNHDWIEVTARMGITEHKAYDGTGPVMDILSIAPCEQPATEVVSF